MSSARSVAVLKRPRSAAAPVIAWRAGSAAGVPILWLLVGMGIWIGLGLVAGIPLVGLIRKVKVYEVLVDGAK